MTSFAFSLFDGQPEWPEIAIASASLLISSAWRLALGRMVRARMKSSRRPRARPKLVARPLAVTRMVTCLLVLPVPALPMLDAIGQRFDVGLDRKSAVEWLLSSGIRIAVILILAWLIIRIVGSATADRAGCRRARCPGVRPAEAGTDARRLVQTWPWPRRQRRAADGPARAEHRRDADADRRRHRRRRARLRRAVAGARPDRGILPDPRGPHPGRRLGRDQRPGRRRRGR